MLALILGLLLLVATPASAIPTVQVTSGVVGSGAGLSGIDVCYAVLGGSGCSLTGDAYLPVAGATTYIVPMNLNFDTDTYASLTFTHSPLCPWNPHGCLGGGPSFGIPWEDSVRFAMTGDWGCPTFEPCIPQPGIPGFHLRGVGTLQGAGDGLTEWSYTYTFTPTVPEPATWVLLGAGLVGVGAWRRWNGQSR